MLQYSNAHK